ncbi:MAG: cupin domain-containing protein [Pseudomonadota bacterium]
MLDTLAATLTTPQGLLAGPWLADGPGKHSRVLDILPQGQGWVELMKLAPGTRIPLHRHTGEVHAYNLQGSRVLSDGRTIRQGEYVFEPSGNVDWWEASGEQELVVFVVVKGTVEYLRADGTVDRVITGETIQRLCDEHALDAPRKA